MTLKDKLIKIGYAHPEIRPDLRKVISGLESEHFMQNLKDISNLAAEYIPNVLKEDKEALKRMGLWSDNVRDLAALKQQGDTVQRIYEKLLKRDMVPDSLWSALEKSLKSLKKLCQPLSQWANSYRITEQGTPSPQGDFVPYWSDEVNMDLPEMLDATLQNLHKFKKEYRYMVLSDQGYLYKGKPAKGRRLKAMKEHNIYRVEEIDRNKQTWGHGAWVKSRTVTLWQIQGMGKEGRLQKEEAKEFMAKIVTKYTIVDTASVVDRGGKFGNTVHVKTVFKTD